MSTQPAQVAVGQELEPLVVEAVDPEKMKTMAAILRDPNPIHYDAEVVRRLGMGDAPVNQGPINLGYLMELVVRWAGSRDVLRRFGVRFLGNVLAGERVTCTGRVTAIDGDRGEVELELQAAVGDRVVLAGTATVVWRGG